MKNFFLPKNIFKQKKDFFEKKFFFSEKNCSFSEKNQVKKNFNQKNFSKKKFSKIFCFENLWSFFKDFLHPKIKRKGIFEFKMLKRTKYIF